jgi:hypothetical protein
MTRFEVPLESWERRALRRFARMERRTPEQQAAVLIRQALQQAGVLRSMQPPHPRTEATTTDSEGVQETT